MLNNLITKVVGSKNDRLLKRLQPTVGHINSFESEVEALSNEQLRGKKVEFRSRLERGETLDDLLPEVFAVVREAGRRELSMRHFDVQLIGGMVLHRGMIAEMKTGEGKTLVATLAAYLNALPGKGVHVITVNATWSGWASSISSWVCASAASNTTWTTNSARTRTPPT